MEKENHPSDADREEGSGPVQEHEMVEIPGGHDSDSLEHEWVYTDADAGFEKLGDSPSAGTKAELRSEETELQQITNRMQELMATKGSDITPDQQNEFQELRSRYEELTGQSPDPGMYELNVAVQRFNALIDRVNKQSTAWDEQPAALSQWKGSLQEAMGEVQRTAAPMSGAIYKVMALDPGSAGHDVSSESPGFRVWFIDRNSFGAALEGLVFNDKPELTAVTVETVEQLVGVVQGLLKTLEQIEFPPGEVRPIL